MTEFLRGWLAGANDMEAGRLVPTSKPWAARKEVHYFDEDDNRIGGDRIVLGPALTAEEAQACLDALKGKRYVEAEPARVAKRKLSLIAKRRG